jgi:integrase
MSTQPKRRKIEPGIFERIGAGDQRLGLEIYFKDANGKPRRRAVHGGTQDARDQLALARARRIKRQVEPDDPRVTFNDVAERFEAAHVAGLRPNSRQAHAAPLRRLRARFGNRRMTSIAKTDVRAFVAALRAEGLKANTVIAHLKTLSAIYAFATDDLGMPVTMPRLKPSERPDPADDQREHRILTDDELARVLEATDPRTTLFFRTLAETGARKSEVLGLTPRRINVEDATIAFREQLDDGGELAPLKTGRSRRTIEITRSLAAELKLAAGQTRVFEHLAHDAVDDAWRNARTVLGSHGLPVIHDLRHTHVSGLIADGWDVAEIAARIGDSIETTLRTYSHEFDAHRRSEQRRSALEARYGAGDGYEMATDRPQQTVTDRNGGTADLATARRVRNRAQ